MINIGLFCKGLVLICPAVSEKKIFKVLAPFFCFLVTAAILGLPIKITGAILKGHHQRNILPKFGVNWLSYFRNEKYFGGKRPPKNANFLVWGLTGGDAI